MQRRLSDSPLIEQASSVVNRLQSQLFPLRHISLQDNSMIVASPEQKEYGARHSALRPLSEVPNMGVLVHTDLETRMCKSQLEKFVNSDCLIYPFEVLVTIKLPKPNDFMWDFKHNFYLSIMYCQVHRYFFPFNRHNSQLFFITNEQQSEDPLMCVNIPSRIMFRSMHLEVPVENSVLVAISAYKDYVAFFRLSSKQQVCQETFKNFCYVPPVWTNRLE